MYYCSKYMCIINLILISYYYLSTILSMVRHVEEFSLEQCTVERFKSLATIFYIAYLAS